MTTKPKVNIQSRTISAALVAIITGVVGLVNEDAGKLLSQDASIILIALGGLFGFLRRITNTKLTWLPLVIGMLCLGMPSCATIDVKVDRSQLKARTETHDIYPSKAVSPMLNSEELDLLIQDKLNKINDSIKTSTK